MRVVYAECMNTQREREAVLDFKILSCMHNWEFFLKAG